MSAIEFSHSAWQEVVESHSRTCGDCAQCGCDVIVFGVYDRSGSRVAAQLATACLAFSYEGELAPAAAQDIADRLAVAYPGMEVLVWADPFMPVADRRSSAFEPVAVGVAP